MKVLNYKLCSSGIKEDKIQNKNKGMELQKQKKQKKTKQNKALPHMVSSTLGVIVNIIISVMHTYI